MNMNMNLRNFGNERMQIDGGGGIGSGPPGNFPLVRQGSIYALTFDELQTTMGSIGKDFGSMNMDELLKNIWNAEETQTMGNSTTGVVQDHGGVSLLPGGYLQRQGSLTLPRTLSQKTVDEVWKDISQEYSNGFGESESSFQQQTLGEITLEEFLVKAGVVREEEEGQVDVKKPINNGLFGDLHNSQNAQNNSSFGIGFQQPNRTTGENVMANRITENANRIAFQSPILPLSINGVRSQQQQNQQQIFPKQLPTLQPYGALPPMGIPTNGHLTSPGIRGGIMGLSDPIMSASLGGGAQVTVANGSPPAFSSDGIGKSNGDASSVSPAPYVFNGVLRGRKSSAVEKVVERRQRRMIKNRESAARSRARKQAYTMELEAEIAKLKEENEKLLKKQEEIIEMQKNQAMELMKMQKGAKRRCLRRTQTAPW